MSRRWKIAIAVLVLLPILAFAIGTAVIYRMLGWNYASRFVIGTVMGTRARPLTNRQFERTPTRVERGRYLVEAARCFTCHSETDSQTDLPLPGAMGAGTVRQLLTTTTYPNITPDWETGAGSWTDDMLARAIREGVGHDGRALIPIMPYANFRYISDDDLASIVVYLRSIPPVHHALPKMKLPLLFKLTAAGFPQPLRDPVPPPDASDPAKLGEYLTHIGMCANCHDGEDKEGHSLPYAGGSMIPGPDEKAKVAAANLTPDPSGITYYDEALFVRTMRTGHVGARELDAAMPWRYFRNLNDDDLKHVFAYLRTLKPIRHRVDNTEPQTYCKVCGQRHGGGALN
jgi:mono/diheme cytochrome c family protein